MNGKLKGKKRRRRPIEKKYNSGLTKCHGKKKNLNSLEIIES